jgi:PmbA protein
MNYLEIAKSVIEQAGAESAQAEAYIIIGKETSIQVSKGEVEKMSYAGSKGMGVRVIRDGQMGYAYTSDFSPESVRRTTGWALALAEAADPDEHRVLPEPAPVPEEDLENFDPAMEGIPAEEKVDFARRMEEAALKADPRVKMALNTSYMDFVGDVFLANSRGFSGSYKSSYAGGFLMAMAFEGQERTTAWGIGMSTTIRKLEPEKIGSEAGERAARLLGGRPVPTQEAAIVYSPFAANGLLGALSMALTAEAMQKNKSFLAGKTGQTVASDMVTLLDNGRLPGGMASRPFDDEGVPTAATRLIDEGILQGVLYDTYTAHKEGRPSSTGNATRQSHRQPPGLTPSNFYLQPGNLSPEQVIAGVERGLYVVNTMNTHSINPVSGDYSVSAQGFWIENGELTHPVNEVTIAIPLDQLLKNVSAVGDDLLFLPFMGAIGSPTFRVDGVMIGGKGG